MALVASVAGLSCQSGMFTCRSNESCSGLEGGLCESNGLCSVPNADCVSGREYAEFSGSDSGECVPGSGGTSTTVAQGSTVDPGGSSEGGSVSTSSAEAGTSSSGEGLADTGATSGGDDSSVGSGPAAVPPCGDATEIYHHDFADGMFAARDWDVNSFGQVEASFDGGTLTVSTDADGMAQHFWWMVSTLSIPTVGSVAMEVVEGPPVDSNGTFWLELTSPGVALSFAVRDDGLRTSIKTGDGPYVEQALGPYNAVDDLWLRVRYDSGAMTVFAETSPDGLSWSPFHEFDTSGFGFDNFNADLGGGAQSGSTYVGDVASVAQISICEG